MSSSPRSSPKISLRQSVRSAQSSRLSSSHDGQAESSSQAGSRLSEHSEPTTQSTPDKRTDSAKKGHLSILRRRARRSGGFLLNTTLNRSENSRREDVEKDAKGKGRASDMGTETDRDTQQNPFSNTGSNGSSHQHRASQYNPHDDKTTGGIESIAEGNRRSTSGVQRDTSIHDSGYDSRPTSAALDPAQLVQMALSLGEARRRHVSAGLVVPYAAIDTRRVRSTGAPVLSVLPGSPHGNDHIPSPRYFATPPSTSRDASRHSSKRASRHSEHQDDSPVADTANEPVLEPEPILKYQFTEATLARAERARQFFELSSEYRRLLLHLPPLKPDALAPGNITVKTTNSPGTNQLHFTRVRSNTNSRHELGRSYNPLQFLRNQRLRRRERRPLDPPVEACENLEKVKSFVDSVELQAAQPNYRVMMDSIDLPAFPDEENSPEVNVGRFNSGHRRTDTASSRISRIHTKWSFSPAELFADTLWVEHGDNKKLIQNRHGYEIFSQPRASFESTGSGRRSKEEQRPTLSRNNTRDTVSTNGEEPSVSGDKKKRKFLSIHRSDKDRHSRFSWHRARSDSLSSVSSADSDRVKRPFQHGNDPHEENTGPLERHMRRMMEKEALAVPSESPELISPDRWDRPSHQKQFINREPLSINTNLDTSPPKADPESSMAALSDDVDMDRINTGDERGHSSTDGFDSTGPNSPVVENFMPSIGMSLSPPGSRRQSPVRKPHLPKLQVPFLRSESKERNNIDSTDFAAKDSSHLDVTSPDGADAPRSSIDSLRPSFIKRHKTTNSTSSNIFRSDTRSRDKEKEPGSTVSRFPKSGRIGEILRSEGNRLRDFAWKREAVPEDDKSTVSDSESTSTASDSADEGAIRKLKKRPTDTSTGRKEGRNAKAKYHIPNLPSFKSNASKDTSKERSTLNSDEVSRLQSSQSSSRLQQLRPPDINVSPQSSPELTKSFTNTTAETYGSDRRGSYGFLSPPDHVRYAKRKSTTSLGKPGFLGAPGHMRGSNSLPMTGLSNLETHGKRHWSISDRALASDTPQQETESATGITTRDIARVRALFMSSGVKARSLYLRAESPSPEPPAFLISAAAAAGKEVPSSLPRKCELICAGQLFSSAISARLTAYSDRIDHFRQTTTPALHTRLEELKTRVADELTPKIHVTADDADAFTAKLNSQQTLAVKQVHDAIDNVLRNRRRRLRWIRRAGYKVLEWAVLSLLWAVWLVVVMVKAVRGVFDFSVGVVRWIFFA